MPTEHLLLTLLCIPLVLQGMADPTEHQNTSAISLEKLSMQLGELSTHYERLEKQTLPALSDDELLSCVRKALDAKSVVPLQAVRDKTLLGPILFHILDIYSKETFELLGVYPQFLAEKFLLLASLIKTVTELYPKDDVPVIVSHASGHLLLEYLLVSILCTLGYKKIVLHTIDTLYESPQTVGIRRHIPIATLQNNFTLDTYSLKLQEAHIKNLFRVFIEKLKAQNITVEHCFASWKNGEQPELHWGIWKTGSDFIWANTTYSENYPQPLIFMTIQPSIPPYIMHLRVPHGLIDDFENFLSFKVLAQKPCLDDTLCRNNTAGCKTDTSRWEVIIPSSPFPPLLVLNREDPALVAQMNNLFTQISNHGNIRASLRTLLQCRAYAGPADNPVITFYDMVAMTAADDRARAFYASLDKQSAYIQRVSSPPRSTHDFIEAIRLGPGAWYAWDSGQKKFNHI